MNWETAYQAGALALALAGAFALKAAWSKPGPKRPWFIILGWALFLVSAIMAAAMLGPVRGAFIALAIACAAGMSVAVSNYTIRVVKARAGRELALEPSDRKRVAWRGWIRGFLAGPMAGIAAMGVGLFVAICFPGAPQTRMVVGGVLVPFLWAGGMAWTLSDDKIIRAFAVLFGVAFLSLGAAFLKGTLA
ncbi:hypothetical protein [Asticcacaulis endophyticus]|uniref:Uncharacterized protein n=1 Tax=Asticcacaulis endophyticus TaxID=1395890 RepID=A0A918UVS0_9CAUL|nr:hypothetical protein [Asticcacaulis endophyticus]GGZ39095.1 hypothetical protein GCM10011273_26880 [Asticcacaulis endophyticus]